MFLQNVNKTINKTIKWRCQKTCSIIKRSCTREQYLTNTNYSLHVTTIFNAIHKSGLRGRVAENITIQLNYPKPCGKMCYRLMRPISKRLNNFRIPKGMFGTKKAQSPKEHYTHGDSSILLWDCFSSAKPGAFCQDESPVDFSTKHSGIWCKARDEKDFHLSAQQWPWPYVQINKVIT